MTAKKIVITNNKGGSGKTTTAVNFGVGLRNKGYNVLLVDLDSQANLSKSLGAIGMGETITEALAEQREIKPYRVIPPGEIGSSQHPAGIVDVLPSNRNLAATEIALATTPDRLTRLNAIINNYLDRYDYIVIDTPPSMGILTISALITADEYILTQQPQYLAVQGLKNIKETINQVEDARGRELPGKILFTQFSSRRKLHALTFQEIINAGHNVYNTIIRENITLAEAPALEMDIFRYNNQSNGAKDYKELVNEYLGLPKNTRI